jgi:hypothetical protein
MHGSKINIKFNEEYCLLKSGSCSTCLGPFSSDTHVRRFMSDCSCPLKGGYELLLASDPRNCRTSWLKITLCSFQVLLHAGVTLFRELTRDTLCDAHGNARRSHVQELLLVGNFNKLWMHRQILSGLLTDRFHENSSVVFVPLRVYRQTDGLTDKYVAANS